MLKKVLTQQSSKSKEGQPTSVCHRYLPLLGFEDTFCLKEDLFIVPNREAFHLVLFFLFGILDKDKRTTDFRDCYPILDKKAESQFRQKAYAWYTALASKNNELPSITASLFQSPGGRKFLDFMNPFIRFVAKNYMKESYRSSKLSATKNIEGHTICKGLTNNNLEDQTTQDRPIIDLNLNNIKKVISTLHKRPLPSSVGEVENFNNVQDSIDPIAHLTKILKLEVQDNMKATSEAFKNLADTHDESKLLIDSMAENYRNLQADLSQESELEMHLSSKIKKVVDFNFIKNNVPGQANEAEVNVDNIFEQLCNDAQRCTSDKRKILDDILDSIMQYIETLEDVTKSNRENRYSSKARPILNVMDLQSLHTTGCMGDDQSIFRNSDPTAIDRTPLKENSLPEILEKLVASAMSSSSISSKKEILPIAGLKIQEVNVDTSGILIKGYKTKFQGIEQKLKEDYTQTEKQLEQLEAEMSITNPMNGIQQSGCKKKVADNDNLDILSGVGGSLCVPSKPLEFKSNIQKEDYKFEEDKTKENYISKENMLEKLPFLLSRFGLPNHILELIQRFNNDVQNDNNGQFEPQQLYNNNENYLKKHGSARDASEQIPRNLNSNLEQNSRENGYTTEKMFQPTSHLEESSHLSSCFSPLKYSKPNVGSIDQVTTITTGMATNYLRRESVISTKSVGDNVSSGMEISKMSIFSPVLSSTIMHGLEKSFKLPRQTSSSTSPPNGLEDCKHSRSSNHDNMRLGHVYTPDAKETQKSSIFEKYQRLKNAQMMSPVSNDNHMDDVPIELPPTPFLFKNKIKYGTCMDSPNPFDILKSDPVEERLDSFEWLDEDVQTGRGKDTHKENISENQGKIITEDNKNNDNIIPRNAALSKPVTKFRLSDSFLLPHSKSPPKTGLDSSNEKLIGINKDIPLLFCTTEETDIISNIPETPLSKYYLSKKKKSRISELISTLSVADVSNGEIDLKLDQKGGATRDNNYSTILNEFPDFIDSDNEKL